MILRRSRFIKDQIESEESMLRSISVLTEVAANAPPLHSDTSEF